MADISKINGYDIKDKVARESIDKLATVANSGDYNDLENKPFYVDRSYTLGGFEFDGNSEGKEILTDKTNPTFTVRYAKIAELTDDEFVKYKEELIKGYTYYFGIGSDATASPGDYLYEYTPDVYTVGVVIFAKAALSDPSIGLDIPSSGIYMSIYDAPFRIEFNTLTDTVKTIDEKFIPDTIARVSDLPCYDNRQYKDVVIEYDGIADGKAVGSAPAISYSNLIKVADFSYDQVDNYTEALSKGYKITTVDANGVETIREGVGYYTFIDGALYVDGGYVVLAPQVFSLSIGHATNYVSEPGIYFANTTDTKTLKLEIVLATGGFKIIEGKYLTNSPGAKMEEGTEIILDDATYMVGPDAEIFNDYKDNIAAGRYSHAEGSRSKALADCSHAEGSNVTATGMYSHVEGIGSEAIGDAAHAEGWSSIATGDSSHAEGQSTEAIGDSSHAEGESTEARGAMSHAEGYKTIAAGDYQHVQGRNNIVDEENKYAHIVGNGGINYGDNEPSNAHTLDWDGNAWFAGNVTIGADNKKLVTEESVNEAINIDYETLTFDTNEIIDGLLLPESTLDTSQLDIMTLSGEDVSSFALEAGDSYNRQNFVPYQILKADHLNNMEDGIIANENAISSNAEAISNMASDIAANNAALSAKQDKLVSGTSIKTINGESILGSGNISIAGGGSTNSAINYDLNVKAINHRGYSRQAPENTIPAYIMSKQMGYTYVECDVSFTADSVAVLLHDSTIDRTSDGSGNIQSLTYQQLLQYDFGSWFNRKYAGTKIPTFKEFMMYCKGLALHPYIELKISGGYTEEQIKQVVDEVELCGMKGKVTYISFDAKYLEYVKKYDEEARLGYLADVKTFTIKTANGLKTGKNEVFMDVDYRNATEEKVALCIENGLPMEVWTVNDANIIKKLNPYVSGVTSDNQIAGKILYDLYSTYTDTDYIPATSITLSKTNLTFEELKSQTLTATVAPSNASGSVVWKSSNTSIATVSKGVVTPLKDGSCTITASIDSVSASCSVTVAMAATVYTITENLTGCTSSNTAVNVIEDEVYADTFKSTLGYTLEGATVSITMGGVDVSHYYSNGTLNIPSVTGDIVVNIIAKEKEIVKYSITRNLTNCTSSSSVTEIIEAESHIETFTPSIEYSLLSPNISITMGGVDISNCYNNRVLNIPSVTGDIVINIEGAKLTSPVIDYAFSTDGTNGILTNTGTGGSTYDIQTVGSYNVVDDKLSLLNGAYASVDYPTTKTGKFTIHIKGSYDSLTGGQYERMFRNDADALCGYYVRDRRNFGIKLANVKGNGGVLYDTSIATWYPDNSNTLNINYDVVGLETMHDYVYTADGTTIKFYFDGKLVASQNQTGLANGTSFALGNIQNTANSYNANITVEKWKIFDYAMNDEEVYELVNLRGIEEYTITRNLTGCTSSNNAVNVVKGKAYTDTFTHIIGYTLEGATVSITMGGVDASNYYNDGVLNIPSVTGDIVVNIIAKEKEAVKYNITRNLTNCTSSSSVTEIIEDKSHTEIFTAPFGYTLEDATVSITMGGTDVSSYYNNGTLSIPSVTGDIVINIVAKEKVLLKYSITRNLTNCTSSSDVTEVTETQPHTETFSADTGYIILRSKVSITMGGTDISNYYNNGTLNIPSVTGDIVINIEGAELTSPVIDYAFSTDGTNGILTNTGTGGSTYDIQTVGEYSVADNKLSLLNGAYASVDYPTTRTETFTIHVRGCFDNIIGNQYERMVRSNNDALCIYYVRGSKNFGVKLANMGGGNNTVYDTSKAGWSGGSNTMNVDYDVIGVETMHDFVFTADGTTIKFYLDGELLASQNQSILKAGTSYALGNIQKGSNSYNANITIEKWRIFAYALSAEEVAGLINYN